MTKMLGILKLREEHNHMTKVCGTLTLPNTYDPNDNCVVSLSLQQSRSMTTFAGASADPSCAFVIYYL